MSNTCSYTARICGEKQNVIDFLWWLVGYGPKIYIDKERVHEKDPNTGEYTGKWITRAREKGTFETGYVGRIGHWDARLQVKEIKNNLFVEIEDWCAWSIASSGMEEYWDNDDNFGQRKSIRSLCRLYDIQFEAFSEETGVGFDEYYFINGRKENNYTEEEFNHSDVNEKISEDGWTLDDDKDIYWRWTKVNGKRRKEKIDKDELFYEIKNKIFPHEFRELDGDEWNFPKDEPIPMLGTFCESNKNSWNIPWSEYVEADRAARGFGPA